MAKFWMVLVDGAGPPTVKHGTKVSAHAEAERLANVTGRRAYVLEATHACEVTRVTWSRLEESADAEY